MAGMSKAEVKILQEFLNDLMKLKPPLEKDGNNGELTQAAITQFQRKFKLKKTGFFNKKTYNAILYEYDRKSKAEFQKAMKDIDQTKRTEPKMYFMVNGKWLGLTQKEIKQSRIYTGKQLIRGPLMVISGFLSRAEGLRADFKEFENDQPIVSYLVHYGVGIPDDKYLKSMWANHAQLTKEARQGNIEVVKKLYPSLENDARELILKPLLKRRSDMVSVSSGWISGLTFVKTSSFIFLSVFAAPVAATALGTGALASAVVGGAAVSIMESTANEIGKYSAEPDDWSLSEAGKNIAIDGAVGGVLGAVTKGGAEGKHILEGAAKKLTGNLSKETGFKMLSPQGAKKAATWFVTEGSKSTLEGAIKDAGKVAKGNKKMTLDKFFGNVIDNFAKGIVFAPIGAALDQYAKNGYDKLSKKDQNEIWAISLKALSKQSKGKTLTVQMIDKQARATGEKIISGQIKNAIDPVATAIFDKAKKDLTAKSFDQELQKGFMDPKVQKKIKAELVKFLQKAFK